MSPIVPAGDVAVGSLVGAEEWSAGASFEVRDPGCLSDVVGTVATASQSNVDKVVRVAGVAQRAWARRSLAERAALLTRAAQTLEDPAETDGLAELLTRENGSVLAISRRELAMAATAIRNAVDLGLELLGQAERFTAAGSWVQVGRRPLGVIAGIVPWNAPVILTAQKVGPAVMAGNAVVVKPSPNAPLAVSLVLRRFASILPPGVINVVHGDGDVGAALIAHPEVRKVSFTGGGATARHIMRSAAGSLTKIHFELGGNDPAMVLDDADIEWTADQIVTQAFRRAGQVCFAIKRVYVPDTIVGALTDAILARAASISVGHGLDPASTMGPVNNDAQFQKIRGMHERLEAAGARVVTTGTVVDPGEWGDGYYLRPAIVPDADPSAEVVTEEQFGPILPIVSYRTEEEAISMANGTEYGLGSSVWSTDQDRAVAFASQIHAGMTFINAHGLSELGHKRVPFGGVKQSGIGWENSSSGFGEYLEYHSIDVHHSDVIGADRPASGATGGS